MTIILGRGETASCRRTAPSLQPDGCQIQRGLSSSFFLQGDKDPDQAGQPQVPDERANVPSLEEAQVFTELGRDIGQVASVP